MSKPKLGITRERRPGQRLNCCEQELYYELLKIINDSHSPISKHKINSINRFNDNYFYKTMKKFSDAGVIKITSGRNKLGDVSEYYFITEKGRELIQKIETYLSLLPNEFKGRNFLNSYHY